jgi:hypothetical protein
MKWLSENDIDLFLLETNYDIRVSNNARWIDQKCTPDVLTIISDCILNLDSFDIENEYFTSMDVWHSDFTVENIQNIFKKPSPNEKKARNEYDKFFQQPMELLSYAGVLEKAKRGNRNYYIVKNRIILEWLSIREKNSLLFLNKYITKVLTDSGIYYLFESFFQSPNKSNYNHMKDGYAKFIINHTPINKLLEPYRIFIKVLNPLSYFHNSYGTERGRISKQKITYDMLMYNRDNFRDVYANKPKDMTRKQYEASIGYSQKDNLDLYKYQSSKAKRLVREYNAMFNNGLSEVYQENHASDLATHMHHIFPESDFPEISGYPENIIALTPTQHLNYAHVNGNTYLISEDFQHIILLAKNDTISNDYNQNIDVYDFDNFLLVLSVGFDKSDILEITKYDFVSTAREINVHFS